MADSVFGEVGGNAVVIQKPAVQGHTDLLPAPNKDFTTTPQKRRAAAQKPSPRKKTLVAGKVFVNSSEAAMDKNTGEEKPTSGPKSNVTTAATNQMGYAPATHESGMTVKEEITPTNIIKSDPEQSVAIPTAPSKNKKPKKVNPKSSVDTEDISATTPKTRRAKVSRVPMPTSWAEASAADRMLVSMRDSGEDWAVIRQQWKEVTGSDTAASTLPTRYSRLKATMTVMEDGDFERLIQAKDQVELRLETEKYAMIADTLEQLGGKRYANVFIRQEVKKMEKTSGAVAATHTTSAAPFAPITAAAAAGGGSGLEAEEETPAAAGTMVGNF